MSFVTTYLSLHENSYYLKGHMVEDPIAKVQFPKYAAGAIAEIGGRTYYVVSGETKDAFAKQRGLPLSAGKQRAQGSLGAETLKPTGGGECESK